MVHFIICPIKAKILTMHDKSLCQEMKAIHIGVKLLSHFLIFYLYLISEYMTTMWSLHRAAFSFPEGPVPEKDQCRRCLSSGPEEP